MNRKQRRISQSKEKSGPVIKLRDRAYSLEEASALGISEYNRGNYQPALDIFQLIIAQAPDYAEAYNSRGSVLASIKRFDEALASFDRTIALNPTHASAYNNRGNVLREFRQYDKALASFDKAIVLNPGFALAHNGRATTLHEMQRYDEAVDSYDKAIALKPDFATAHNLRGYALQALKHYDEALASYDKAIAMSPGFTTALNNRGAVLHEMKRYGEALDSFDKALALQPNFAMALNNRGIVLHELKRYDEALASYDKAIAIDPNNANNHYSRGSTLQSLNLYDDALASFDKAIALNPDYAKAYHSRGNILSFKGNMQGAEEMIRKSIALNPDYPEAFYSLAQIRKYKDVEDADSRQIQRFLTKPGISSKDRELLYFTLGKIYDDCKHYDEAFEWYRQGNLICNAHVSYNSAKIDTFCKNCMKIFTREFLAQPFLFSSASRQPVFIVGMPRSGTTLMTSILSNHPSIASAGELQTMMDLAVSRLPELIPGNIPYPDAVKHLTPSIASRLIGDYEKRLQCDAGSGMPYIIDKHPMNFTNIGLIAMLFPHAPIIHCTRTPLDTCLSIYFQHFALTYDYSFDLQNIAHSYREYTRIMEHWRNVLPGKIIDISYEDMVVNTETIARKVLDSLGLEWDERCLTPHTNTYAVETSSKWQVRQPIYKQSVERWRNYEKHLQPLKDILQLNQ